MLILGIDPGSRTTGFGIIEQLSFKARYIASGCIRVDKHPWPERLKYIFESIVEIIVQYKPTWMVVEQVFVHKNIAAALKLGQARGAALVAGTHLGLQMAEYSARQVKKAVMGYGAAEKAQIQFIVKNLLKLNALPQEDAADALAIALCHGYNTLRVRA